MYATFSLDSQLVVVEMSQVMMLSNPQFKDSSEVKLLGISLHYPCNQTIWKTDGLNSFYHPNYPGFSLSQYLKSACFIFISLGLKAQVL